LNILTQVAEVQKCQMIKTVATFQKYLKT